MYYEEPVHPLNAVSMREIKDKIKIPIASGERIYTRLGYRPFFENRSLSVIQPDVCLCGGISETKKICDMADTYDVKVQVHVCGGPISQAAALHVETVIPNFLIHEMMLTDGKLQKLQAYLKKPLRQSTETGPLPLPQQQFLLYICLQSRCTS